MFYKSFFLSPTPPTKNRDTNRIGFGVSLQALQPTVLKIEIYIQICLNKNYNSTKWYKNYTGV